MKKQNKTVATQILSPFHEFFKAEASAGILLMAATAIAFAWANSSWSDSYFHLWEVPAGFYTPQFQFTKTVHHWINDGLMAVFFFVVGLEIKREMIAGELASLKKATLPILAAAGGMVVPAGIYIALNHGGPASGGWGIPMATDIAFSLGVLALLGPRAPLPLKVFLSAFAIVDDIGAVLVIALFYTASIAWSALGFAAGILALLLLLNRLRVHSTWPYLVLGACLWFFILKSGIHATVAGVLLALFIPSRAPDEQTPSPMKYLEHLLHPWVAFVIVPLFALANAGVRLEGADLDLIMHPVFLGIAAGLIIGKQIGILLFSWLGVRFGMASLPKGVCWRHVYGAGWLGGIGFTMSVFITTLAFDDPAMLTVAKLAILAASVLSAVGGWLLLRRPR